MQDGTIKKGWKICKLIDIATINMGQSPKSEYYSENKDDIPFLQGCTEFGILYPEIRKYCNKPIKIANEGDILFSVRAPVGLINLSPNRCCIGRGLCSMNSIYHKDNYFLMYLLKGNIEYIKRFGQGSIYDAINKIELGNIELCIPESIDIQQKIASFLINYDDLIENNNRRIQILEQTAQEIYKEWFVNFRFPGHETIKMIDSGTDFGEIPEGWEIEKIENILMPVKRKGKLQTTEYLEKGSTPIIDQGKEFIGGYSDNFELAESELLPMVIFGDHTRILKYIDFPFICGADGTQLLYPKNKELLPAYFYLAIKNVDLGNFHYARHFKFLKEQYIIIPDTNTLYSFHNIVGENFKLIGFLREQNTKLRETRGLLLPKLISGEIDVSELEVK